MSLDDTGAMAQTRLPLDLQGYLSKALQIKNELGPFTVGLDVINTIALSGSLDNRRLNLEEAMKLFGVMKELWSEHLRHEKEVVIKVEQQKLEQLLKEEAELKKRNEFLSASKRTWQCQTEALIGELLTLREKEIHLRTKVSRFERQYTESALLQTMVTSQHDTVAAWLSTQEQILKTAELELKEKKMWLANALNEEKSMSNYEETLKGQLQNAFSLEGPERLAFIKEVSRKRQHVAKLLQTLKDKRKAMEDELPKLEKEKTAKDIKLRHMIDKVKYSDVVAKKEAMSEEMKAIAERIDSLKKVVEEAKREEMESVKGIESFKSKKKLSELEAFSERHVIRQEAIRGLHRQVEGASKIAKTYNSALDTTARLRDVTKDVLTWYRSEVENTGDNLSRDDWDRTFQRILSYANECEAKGIGMASFTAGTWYKVQCRQCNKLCIGVGTDMMQENGFCPMYHEPCDCLTFPNNVWGGFSSMDVLKVAGKGPSPCTELARRMGKGLDACSRAWMKTVGLARTREDLKYKLLKKKGEIYSIRKKVLVDLANQLPSLTTSPDSMELSSGSIC